MKGILGFNAKKRILCDDLSQPEWAVGQLSNVSHIHDTNLARQDLLRVILALKDATGRCHGKMPWEAVRSAWGNSMHEIEQGTLSWEDNIQWSLNRLSPSQIALANARTINQPSFQRTKYANFTTKVPALINLIMATSGIIVCSVLRWTGS